MEKAGGKRLQGGQGSPSLPLVPGVEGTADVEVRAHSQQGRKLNPDEPGDRDLQSLSDGGKPGQGQGGEARDSDDDSPIDGLLAFEPGELFVRVDDCRGRER